MSDGLDQWRKAFPNVMDAIDTNGMIEELERRGFLVQSLYDWRTEPPDKPGWWWVQTPRGEIIAVDLIESERWGSGLWTRMATPAESFVRFCPALHPQPEGADE